MNLPLTFTELPFPAGAIETATRILPADLTPDGIPPTSSPLGAWAVTCGIDSRELPTESYLTLLLMHAIANEDTTPHHLANTLERRLTRHQRARIGITDPAGGDWGSPLEEARARLVGILEPIATTRIDSKGQHWLTPDFEMANQLAAVIVRNSITESVATLTGHDGYTAIASTLIATPHETETGARYPLAIGMDRPRHGFSRPHRTMPAVEVSIATTTHPDNTPNLILAIAAHAPGDLKVPARELPTQLAGQPVPTEYLVAHRGYGALRPDLFRRPIRELGFKPVHDYGPFDRGVQSHYDRYLLIDGSWYRDDIPDHLIDATRSHVPDARLDDIADAREPYRLRPSGAPGTRGQRYRIPPNSHMHYPAAVTIPHDIDQASTQGLVYGSLAWSDAIARLEPATEIADDLQPLSRKPETSMPLAAVLTAIRAAGHNARATAHSLPRGRETSMGSGQ